MDLYPWVVFIHVAAAFLFAIAYGFSAVKRRRLPEAALDAHVG